MPPFRPAKAAVPKSGLGVRVPFRERPKDIPKDDDEPKPEGAGGRPGAVLWARRLPYKMVQGSHIGHGIRMEPSRKEPPEWKDPKRRLKFGAAPAEAAAGAAGVNDENAGPAKANAASPAAAPAPTKAAAGSKSRASGAHGKGGGARNGGGAGGRAAGGTTKATANNGKPGGKHGGRSAPNHGRTAAAPSAAAPAAAAPSAAAPAAAAPAAAAPPPASPTSTDTDTAAAVSGSAPGDAGSAREKELREVLMMKQLEVEYLLRSPLDSHEAIVGTRERVRRALAFDDELGALGLAHEMSKGRIFQALLEELRIAGADHAQLDNTARKESAFDYSAEFGADKWEELAQGADTLRKLVRIKVADDNDLKTARSGLLICRDFLDGLEELAKLCGVADEHGLYKGLDLTA